MKRVPEVATSVLLGIMLVSGMGACHGRGGGEGPEAGPAPEKASRAVKAQHLQKISPRGTDDCEPSQWTLKTTTEDEVVFSNETESKMEVYGIPLGTFKQLSGDRFGLEPGSKKPLTVSDAPPNGDFYYDIRYDGEPNPCTDSYSGRPRMTINVSLDVQASPTP
jgi:hypothetical protein